MWHNTPRHGAITHGGIAVPCRIVSPCRGRGPGAALQAISRVITCRRAHGSSCRHASLPSRMCPQPLVVTTNASPSFATARTCSSCAAAPAPLTPPQGHAVDTTPLRDAMSPPGRTVDTTPQRGRDLRRAVAPA